MDECSHLKAGGSRHGRGIFHILHGLRRGALARTAGFRRVDVNACTRKVFNEDLYRCLKVLHDDVAIAISMCYSTRYT